MYLIIFIFRKNQGYVDCLRTYNITCSAERNTMTCTSDGNVITIPDMTTCQIDDQAPVSCQS